MCKFCWFKDELVQGLGSHPKITVGHQGRWEVNKIINRREWRLRNLGECARGQICKRWPGIVEGTKALEQANLRSNLSYAFWTNKLLICPESQVSLTCEMEIITASVSFWGYRVKHNNACHVFREAGFLAGIQYVRVNNDNNIKAHEGVIKN